LFINQIGFGTIRLEFYSDELKIVQEDEEFLKNKAMIQSRINKIDDGTVQYFTFDE